LLKHCCERQNEATMEQQGLMVQVRSSVILLYGLTSRHNDY